MLCVELLGFACIFNIYAHSYSISIYDQLLSTKMQYLCEHNLAFVVAIVTTYKGSLLVYRMQSRRWTDARSTLTSVLLFFIIYFNEFDAGIRT